jgi:hypothetical protein
VNNKSRVNKYVSERHTHTYQPNAARGEKWEDPKSSWLTILMNIHRVRNITYLTSVLSVFAASTQNTVRDSLWIARLECSSQLGVRLCARRLADDGHGQFLQHFASSSTCTTNMTKIMYRFLCIVKTHDNIDCSALSNLKLTSFICS